MKNSLLIFFFLFFISNIIGQVSFPSKENFTLGVSVGVSRVKYLFKLGFGFGEETRSIFSQINTTSQFDWCVGYNLEYRINKNFSVRTMIDFSGHKTVLTLKEFSGINRQYEFGSFDVGLPLHLMYRMGNKKLHPIVFMGFRTMLINEIGKDDVYVNLSNFESGFEAGIGFEMNTSKYRIRQEVGLYSGVTYWLNDDYFYARRILHHVNRDFISFRLVFTQNKG
jgi:Outer membrane protein beta-barrel domain